MKTVLLLMGLLAGAVLPTQAGINAMLTEQWARNPVLTACASFAVGTVALAGWVFVARLPVASPAGTSWWHWTGGLLGAFFVAAVTFLAPRLGAVTTVVLVIAGQLVVASLLDHFGLLGYRQRSFDLMRALGVAFVLVGVFLVRR